MVQEAFALSCLEYVYCRGREDQNCLLKIKRFATKAISAILPGSGRNELLYDVVSILLFSSFDIATVTPVNCLIVVKVWTFFLFLIFTVFYLLNDLRKGGMRKQLWGSKFNLFSDIYMIY